MYSIQCNIAKNRRGLDFGTTCHEQFSQRFRFGANLTHGSQILPHSTGHQVHQKFKQTVCTSKRRFFYSLL